MRWGRPDPARFGLPEPLAASARCAGEGDLPQALGTAFAPVTGCEELLRPSRGSLRSLPLLRYLQRTPESLPVLSPSAIEQYLHCPYRWFVQSCIRPEAPDCRGSGRGSWAISPMKPLPASTTGSPRRACDAWTRRTSRPWCPGSRRSWTSLSASSPSAEGALALRRRRARSGSGWRSSSANWFTACACRPRCPRATKWSSASIPSRSPTAWTLPASGCGGASTASMPTQSGDVSW